MHNRGKKRGTSSGLDRKREDQTLQQQVQQEAVRLSIEHELGRLKREYDMGYGCHPLFIAALQLLFILFFGFLTYFLFSSFLQSLQAAPVSGNGNCCITKVSFSGDTDPHDSPLGFLIFASLGGLVVSIFFCWNYWRGYPLRHSRQFLYEYGFLLIACRGKRIIGSDAIRWRNIGTIWHTFSYNSDADSKSENYIIQDRDSTVFGSRIGKRLKEPSWLRQLIQRLPLSHVKHSRHSAPSRSPRHKFDAELGKQVEQLALPYLLPQALTIFEQGLPVHFGPLALHTRGIEYQGKLLPWHEFDRSHLVYHPSTDKEPATLSFRKQEDQPSRRKKYWAVVSSPQIPNFVLLRPLILSIVETRPSVSYTSLVAGEPAAITYHGLLAATASSITMHWGLNSWKGITDTSMTRQNNGTWKTTIMIRSEATELNMAFHDQNDAWDNHQHRDYSLKVSPHSEREARLSAR